MNASRAMAMIPAEPAAALRFNAPLFGGLLKGLDCGTRCVVLDLGAARAQTVALVGRYRCRLEIADLADGLDGLNAETEPEQLRRSADTLLPALRDESFDAVLCWDLLNYLERPALRALMACIAARSRPGTAVHALIVYAGTHMPARAGQFVPANDHSLIKLSASRPERAAPRYSPGDLMDCMPGYALERAMLLSNGMQEMLFRV